MTKKSGNGASVSARDINSNEGGADTHDTVLHKLGVPAGLGTMRALEPRILLDAAALATFADAASDQAAMEASQWQREQQSDLPPASEAASGLPTANQVAQNPPLPAIDENSLNDDFSLTERPTTPSSNQIVFIDSAIEDLQSIVESIGDNIEIIIIDANSDGVEQIASVLENRKDIDAIHIFSHGRSGTLDLGSTKLTEASIASRHADEMEIIRAALSENADILIYGCDFGANARGVSAIDALAEATGADIAASEDLTGAANLGGDWDLEIEAGSVETEVIAAAAFAGVLIDSDGDFIDDLVDDDDDNDGILDADEKVLSTGTSESFESPPVVWPTDRDGFANAFPTGSSALSNFAGSAGYFTGPNPTSGTATFIDAYEGISYSGLHSGETFAQEIVALDLSIPVTAGTDVGLSFAAYQMNFGPTAAGGLANPSTSRDQKAWTKDITFTWHILDFGLSYVRAKQAADQTLIAEEQKRKVINRIIEDVRTAYWRAVSADRLLSGFNKLEGRVHKALRNSRALKRSGHTSPVAALTFERELVDIKRQTQRLQRELQTAKIQLAALMNVRPDDHYKLVLPKRKLSSLNITIPTDEIFTLALQNRPELREIAYRGRIEEKEAKAALLELLPGIQLYAGSNFDSNSFLLNSNWVSWGAKASWNAMRLFQYPAKKKVINAGLELNDQRALAMTMAIMTQVQVAQVRYHYLKKSAATSSEYYHVQRQIRNQVRASARANASSQQSVIREEMNTLVASAQYDIAYSDLQNAFAAIYSSIGVDPFGDILDTSASVDELANALRSTWRERGDVAG